MPNFNLKNEEIEAIVTALLGFNDDKVGKSLLAESYIPDYQIYDGDKLPQGWNYHILFGMPF